MPIKAEYLAKLTGSDKVMSRVSQNSKENTVSGKKIADIINPKIIKQPLKLQPKYIRLLKNRTFLNIPTSKELNITRSETKRIIAYKT